jgi:tellurite resistance protein TerC
MVVAASLFCARLTQTGGLLLMDGIWFWVLFNVFVLVVLALDLGIFHRDDHTISVKEALLWSGIWTLLAVVFNLGIWLWMGSQAGLEFFTGYVIERSLSIDNIFVFILVFSYFAVPPKYQYKVLFWGILGALIMRILLILAGAALIKNFHWVIYLFGALLVFSGIKMALQREGHMEPDKNPLVKLARRFMRVTPEYHNGHFFTRIKGVLYATPLFLVLLVVESTDLVFALDSIPAIFAITEDPFIVYTSNVFAILGLRALYFALAGIMDRFRYLKVGLSATLVFVGVKMLLSDIVKIPVSVSLGVVLGVIALSIVASLLIPPKEEKGHDDPQDNALLGAA